MATQSIASTRSEKRVLLLVESSRAYGRGCLQGIASYLRTHPEWEAVHLERGLSENVPREVRRQPFDGVIARIENRTIEKTLAEMNVPVVDLRGMITPSGGVAFDTDPVACAEKAFEHFSERGFRHLAFCGYQGLAFSDERCAGFCDLADAQGVSVHVYESGARNDRTRLNDTIAREANGEHPEREMIQWISALPSPIGLFACNDIRGRQVLRAVQLAGRVSPEEIAVLGVDDDEVICELAHPSMSSIEPDTYRMGFEAAQTLSRLMDGEAIEEQRILIPPTRVMVRQSTDLLAVEDPEVAKAIHLIRSKAFDGISVAEVANHLAISRVTMERKFRAVLGRSPREEIERVRINQVRLLLTETNYSLSKIARMTGFSNDSYLVTAFRRHETCTPGQYRKQLKGAAAPGNASEE
ncbi:AraC family transcriptional regulator [Rhodopirellula sp. JC639]|uniref:AraC family transcriptional regulator n=1 Tax=Stieleria mannarensis TaxID=2755585 RepID=UPI0015FFFD9E|nr:DNA-binding transcriptional regulator [Rhodopirellula sp. JC639]